MPWKPAYTESEARSAIEGAGSWLEVLDALGINYHGKNIATLRKWTKRWRISTDHLFDNRGLRRARYTDAELAEAIAASLSWAETLRRLGCCPSGGNWRTLKRRTTELGISVDHFDPRAALRKANTKRSLEEVLVKGSTYSRSSLKRRLFDAGLKDRLCEICGQDETWQGRAMGLILDHINGIRDDRRLENLRIVCPNCAATLDTHCGRKNKIRLDPKQCLRCGTSFVPRYESQRYCSRSCGNRWERPRYTPQTKLRVVDRPPLDQLLAEIDELGYSAVGRKYGVSDNAIRKWVRQHERERAVEEGRDADVVEIPRRTWPNRRRDRNAA